MVETSQVLDYSYVDTCIDNLGSEKGALIPVLQRTQEFYGYLPKEVLTHIADRLDLPVSNVLGVASFYSQFYLTRRGRNIVKVCDGTACHVSGAPVNLEHIQSNLHVKPGETSPDYEYSLEVVYCLGACAIAPVAVVNGQVVGRATPDKVQAILDNMAAHKGGNGSQSA